MACMIMAYWTMFSLACIVMAYIVMAYIIIVYWKMFSLAYVVMAYIFMACIIMAHFNIFHTDLNRHCRYVILPTKIPADAATEWQGQ